MTENLWLKMTKREGQSWFLRSFGSKNYPKLTLGTSKSNHWVQSYSHFIFHVSWFLQWPDHWIGLQKLPMAHLNPTTVSKAVVISFFKSADLYCYFNCYLKCTFFQPVNHFLWIVLVYVFLELIWNTELDLGKQSYHDFP